MNGNDNGKPPERFTANRNRTDNQNNAAAQNQNAKPRFKIKDGNIIRINPDGTTTSRPLTDDERRRLEEARMNAARQRQSSSTDEAARRRADQKYLARSQTDAAEQLGVTGPSPAERRRRNDGDCFSEYKPNLHFPKLQMSEHHKKHFYTFQLLSELKGFVNLA